MIKVIASDLDGTLLGNDGRIAPQTLEALHRACDAGIRFIITTGRNFRGAMKALKGMELTCDYLVSSGAEVRDCRKEIVSCVAMDIDLCREIYSVLKNYPVSSIFATDDYDYQIGTYEEIEERTLLHLKSNFMNMSMEEIKNSELFGKRMGTTKIVRDFQELEEADVPIYKIFLFSNDREMLERIEKNLADFSSIAVSSSFSTNLEITDIRAQKGPVLKKYIESLGYRMEEVMVFGDSRNDCSMLAMDFGATVAMGNADLETKKTAKYVTKSNVDLGVAYVIDQLL